MKREVSADGGALFRTLVQLWPYIWPSDRRDLKSRVVLATVLLFAAKLATIAVPFTFKWATDALAGHGTAPVAPANLARLGVRRADRDDARLWRHAHPDGAAHPIARRHLRQGGDARGAPARDPHLRAHAPLSLRFHLERKTGGLTRVLERGRNGIETIVRMVILQLVPTIVEVALIVVRAALSVRLALRGRDHRHRRALHVVHLCRDRVAHQHPPHA